MNFFTEIITLFTQISFYQLQTSGIILHTSPHDCRDPWAATSYFWEPLDHLETLENG